MQISEVARLCLLSIDTIRFYEKQGLIPSVPRARNGHRIYTQHHVDWLTLIYWMRATDMPLSQIRRFADLAAQGNKTHRERWKMLTDHQKILQEKRKILDQCEAVLAAKISSYEVEPSS